MHPNDQSYLPIKGRILWLATLAGAYLLGGVMWVGFLSPIFAFCLLLNAPAGLLRLLPGYLPNMTYSQICGFSTICNVVFYLVFLAWMLYLPVAPKKLVGRVYFCFVVLLLLVVGGCWLDAKSPIPHR